MKSSVSKAGCVFQEDPAGLHFANDTSDVGPDPPLVFDALSGSGDAPGLARESRRDEIHDATPRSTVEGGYVTPDRSLIQGRVFHPRHECGCGVSLALDEDTTSIVRECQVQSEVDASDAGAEGHAVESPGT